MAFKKKDPNFYKAVPLDDDGNPVELAGSAKAKATAQVVGGAALAVAGVPLMVLPGVGAVTTLTGAAVALNGERKLSGREATAIEQALETAGETIADRAKEAAGHATNQAGKKLREASSNLSESMPDAFTDVARGVKNATLSAAERVPAAAASAAKSVQEAGSVIADEGPKAVAAAAAATGAAAGVIGGAAIAGVTIAKKLSHK